MAGVARFFVDSEQISGHVVELDQDDALHLDRVLRAKVGDAVTVMDGSGKQYAARLTSLNKSRATAEITASESPDTEPPVYITIAQALPKTAEKLEWVLQHGVEIGASEFVIFRSRRSEAGKLAERPERWAKIIKTAAEQAMRVKLPGVSSAPSLQHAVEMAGSYDLAVLCDEAERKQLLDRHMLSGKPKSILAVVGPEGGWADEERQVCLDAGIKPVTLGSRILRTETAALVVLSRILAFADN